MDLEIVSNELNSKEFVLKTQRQIIKDFGTVDIFFPEDFAMNPLTMEQLLSCVSVRLKELDSTSKRAFSQLLYQIDLPENLLPALSATDDFYMSLAEVVLKREAYKVFLRKKYS